MPDRNPWRAVTHVDGPRTGRGSVLGPDTSRRTAWWVLTLTCAHQVERTARYRPLEGWPAQRGGTQHRSVDDVLPAPQRVRCQFCPRQSAPMPMAANGELITEDEARAIAALHQLARRWPPTLKLVSMGGGLHVIHDDDERFHDLGSHTRGDAILDTFHGIPNDGGDW